MSLGERVAALEATQESLTGWMKAHEERCASDHADVQSRLGRIERLVWMSLGGVTAVGGLATFFGWNILKALAH